MKSGTTFLSNILKQHKDIKLLERRMDYSFFDDDRIYGKGLSWYGSLFDKFQEEANKGALVGQTSADCAFNPGTIERISKDLPNVKLIFVLRHPIDRAYSMYWHQYGVGRERYSFAKAVKIEKKRIAKNYYNFKHYSYVERSKYFEQFTNIFNIVPRSNILIIPFDALVKDTLHVANSVFNFLGVSIVSTLNELRIDTIPRNRSRLPSLHFLVLVSYYLQKIGLVNLGRRLIYLNRIERRPPPIDPNTKRILEESLEKDILLFQKVLEEWGRN